MTAHLLHVSMGESVLTNLAIMNVTVVLDGMARIVRSVSFLPS